MPTDADLARRAARFASQRSTVLLAGRVLLLAAASLVAGAILARLPHPDLAALARPFAYVAHPLVHAWRHDLDLSLLGYVALQLAAWTLVVSRGTTALGRRAAYGVGAETTPDDGEIRAFVSRRWGSLVRARVAWLLALLVPLGLFLILLGAGLAAPSGWLRLLGILGGVPFALVALLVLAWRMTACFVPPSFVVVEDAGARAALAASLVHAAAAPGRAWRKRAYFGGRALGAILVRLGVVAAAAAGGYLALRLVFGAEAMGRALAVLAAGGMPADAARLGVRATDPVLAAALAVGLATLAVAWFADAWSRIVAARVAAYLALRRDEEQVPPSALGPRDLAAGHQDAAAASFVEVGRVP